MNNDIYTKLPYGVEKFDLQMINISNKILKVVCGTIKDLKTYDEKEKYLQAFINCAIDVKNTLRDYPEDESQIKYGIRNDLKIGDRVFLKYLMNCDGMPRP